MKNDFYFNGFEKAKERGQKYFKIMVKLAETTLRSTKLSIAYSPCYSIVLMCYNGSRLGEVAEHKTSLELQMFKLKIGCQTKH